MRRVDVVRVVAHDELAARRRRSRSRSVGPGRRRRGRVRAAPRRAPPKISGLGLAEVPLADQHARRRAAASGGSCWTTSTCTQRSCGSAISVRRTPASICSGIVPVSGSAVRRRSTVSSPRPLRMRLARQVGQRARARSSATARARLDPHAADGERDRRQHERADRQQRPARARAAPSPRATPTSTAHASADDRPAEAEHASRPRRRRPAWPGRAARRSAWASRTMPALPAAVLALAGQDQPGRDVGEHAEPEQQRGEHERRAARAPRATPQRAARPAQTPPSQRPWRGRVVGAGTSFIASPLSEPPRRAFTSRDCPERVSGISRTG